ncbi:helix-turn-helix domain-containing protein [Reyranella sp.]|uniref:helix-turn-helix domain-containing protein n=1 Tax=Reyranella sp. TaxID=1929291 RepID=UPI004035841E
MLRLAHTDASQDDDTEESVTVAEAARRLGCATSTVRALIDSGDLTGHRVGKGTSPRGVRVHAASIRHYKGRNTLGPAQRPTPAPAESGRQSASPGAAEARRYLRAMGML